MKRDSRTQNQTSNDLPPMIAWHVVERGEKSYWTRIGAVWEHGDGKGYNVDLDLMPIKTGRVVLRDRPDDNEG